MSIWRATIALLDNIEPQSLHYEAGMRIWLATCADFHAVIDRAGWSAARAERRARYNGGVKPAHIEYAHGNDELTIYHCCFRHLPCHDAGDTTLPEQDVLIEVAV